jgi:hypothetical protein
MKQDLTAVEATAERSAIPHSPELPDPATSPRRLRSLEEFLRPLDERAEVSRRLLPRSPGWCERGAWRYPMPRYLFLGPPGGGDYLRLGVFAAIHGDEPEGAQAIQRLVESLEAEPDLARGYALFLYPVCNPTGFERAVRPAVSGRDLNREFWRGSKEPEVRLLETEIWTHAFHGIVSLHADDTSAGLYGFVSGAVLSEYLLEPALRAGERFLPRNQQRIIDGFASRHGMIYQSYEGVLRAPAGLVPPPFEIIFETPQRAAPERQVAAAHAALLTILETYRVLMAVAQDI